MALAGVLSAKVGSAHYVACHEQLLTRRKFGSQKAAVGDRQVKSAPPSPNTRSHSPALGFAAQKGGLGHMPRLGGATKAADFRPGYEDFKLFGIHARHGLLSVF